MNELLGLSNSRPGAVVWMTGLSGAGKSTIAVALHAYLSHAGLRSIVLDGDVLRHGLNADLGFEVSDRTENIRRVAYVAELFKEQEFIAIAALISPDSKHRQMAREIVGRGFVEVFVDAPISICEARDAKGLYAKARCGTIPNFTGVSARYEEPIAPDVWIKTNILTVDAAVEEIVAYLAESRIVRTECSEFDSRRFKGQNDIVGKGIAVAGYDANA
jgi:adenylylsulfate kinase